MSEPKEIPVNLLDMMAKANAGSWSLYEECAKANEGLAAENGQLLARIAELEAELTRLSDLVDDEDAAIIATVLKRESAGGE